MFGMGVYDQMKEASQDILAPEIHALRGEIRVISEKITALDQKVDDVDARLTGKIDGVDRELHVAIDIRERLAALEARRSSLTAVTGRA